MSISIKNPEEIELMKEAGRILAITHEELKKAVSSYAMKGFKVYYNEHGRSN